jgi:hypothetical protein
MNYAFHNSPLIGDHTTVHHAYVVDTSVTTRKSHITLRGTVLGLHFTSPIHGPEYPVFSPNRDIPNTFADTNMRP